MVLAPIVLFVYNRLEHTKKTVQALQKNELSKESTLYIYSDGPKNNNSEEEVLRLRSYLKEIKGFKEIIIIERDRNYGLANSVINGVDEVIKKHGKVIALEDDLITSTFFLRYMNDALDFYKKNDKIFSVTGFSFSREFLQMTKNHQNIYFHYRPMSWSWGTWSDRWEKVDWDIKDYHSFIRNKKERKEFSKGGKDLFAMLKYQLEGFIDSWYIRWTYGAFKFKMYTVYPVKSFINNIGHDDSGVHGRKEKDNIFSHTEMVTTYTTKFENEIYLDENIIKRFNKAFEPTNIAKIKIAIKRILRK